MSSPRNPHSTRDERKLPLQDKATQTCPTLQERKSKILKAKVGELNDKLRNIESSFQRLLSKAIPAAPARAADLSLNEVKNVNVNNTLQEVPIEFTPKVNTMSKTPMVENCNTPEVPDEKVEEGPKEMVPIGPGKTLIPKHILDQLDWKSYTTATRKLLMAVFPRKTLATHSLTGKSSPAFMNKPAKLCLEPEKVNDIVATVSAKCNVKENLVRGAIRTKCADENKMLRMRQLKMEKSEKNEDTIENNQENIPPADSAK